MNAIEFEGQTLYPSKVICLGRNYAAHAAELNNEVPQQPVIFIKPNSAISDRIVLSNTDSIHYEGEITFLVLAGEICGLGFGLDLTKREVQNQLKTKGLPWERAKAFDGAAVFSPFIPLAAELLDQLRMELWINGELKQAGDSSQMLAPPRAFLAEAADIMTLADGDLLMSGTPKGVGPLQRGDQLTGKIYAQDRLLLTARWQAH